VTSFQLVNALLKLTRVPGQERPILGFQEEQTQEKIDKMMEPVSKK